MSDPPDDPGGPVRPTMTALTVMVVTVAVAVPLVAWAIGAQAPLVTLPRGVRPSTSTAATLRTAPAESRPARSATTAPTVPTRPTSEPPAPAPPTARAAPASVDQRPPSAVRNLRLVDSEVSSVTVAWDPASDNVAIERYVVLQDGVPVPSSTDTVVRLDWLRRGSRMLVQVAARDSAGNQSEWRSLVLVPMAEPTGAPGVRPDGAPTVTMTVTATQTPQPTTPTPTPTPGPGAPSPVMPS